MTFGRRRGLALALTPAGSGERSQFSGGRGELVARGALPGLFASVGSRATQRESPSPVAASVGFLWPVCWSSRGSGVGTPSNDPARILESRNPSSGASRETCRSRPVGPALPSIDGGACWGLPPSVRDARPPGLCVTPRPAPAPPTAQRGFLNRPCGAAPFATPCESHVPPLPSPAVTPWKPRAPADAFFLTVW